jgi:hypothetical protein
MLKIALAEVLINDPMLPSIGIKLPSRAHDFRLFAFEIQKEGLPTYQSNALSKLAPLTALQYLQRFL